MHCINVSFCFYHYYYSSSDESEFSDSSSTGFVNSDGHLSSGKVSSILDVSSLMITTKQGLTILDGIITRYSGDQHHSVSNVDLIPVFQEEKYSNIDSKDLSNRLKFFIFKRFIFIYILRIINNNNNKKIISD